MKKHVPQIFSLWPPNPLRMCVRIRVQEQSPYSADSHKVQTAKAHESWKRRLGFTSQQLPYPSHLYPYLGLWMTFFFWNVPNYIFSSIVLSRAGIIYIQETFKVSIFKWTTGFTYEYILKSQIVLFWKVSSFSSLDNNLRLESSNYVLTSDYFCLVLISVTLQYTFSLCLAYFILHSTCEFSSFA